MRWIFALAFVALLLTACSAPTDDPGRLAANLRLRVVAGPVCPVESVPPDPACAPRPVAEARLRLEGPETRELVSDSNGLVAAHLAPGDYLLTPQPVDGLLGTAGEQRFRIEADGTVVELTVDYDTGIR